ncbi:hypothetical protein Q0F98_40030 [Paenibacillus amylolyticus]|nr:hypothetical protein Q0F98_40030 [Paenibacillus amylolyticus]
MNQTAASVESMVETQMMEESIEYYLRQLKPEYRVLVELRWKKVSPTERWPNCWIPPKTL